MNVRDLQIELRPRTNFEAVDMGVAIARRHYIDLLKIGFIGIFPFALLLLIVLWKYANFVAIFIWFLKPVYDRFYLYYLSRRIFGQEVMVKDVLKQWRVFLWKGVLPLLTIRRFSPFRSMTLPVSDLETLKGKAFSKRCEVVKRTGGQTAVVNTFTFLKIEMIFMFSSFLLILLFAPQGTLESFDDWIFFLESESTAPERFLNFSYAFFYLLVVLLIEPLYVATGFSLYLNSRTKQELWDVELRFREYGERVKKATMSYSAIIGFVVLGLFIAAVPNVKAEGQAPEVVIQEVLADEDFEIHTKTKREWIPNETNFDWLDRLFDGWFDLPSEMKGAGTFGFGNLVKLFGYAAIAAMVVFLLYLARNYFGTRGKRESNADVRLIKRPETVMGMQITKKSLPKDILKAAESLWEEGRPRDALSILYRGSLHEIIHRYEVEIEPFFTEYECLRSARSTLPAPSTHFFQSLSQYWINAAYSAAMPSDHEFATLCQKWPFQTP